MIGIEQTPNDVMEASSHKDLAKIYIETSVENRALIKIIERLEQRLKRKKERISC